MILHKNLTAMNILYLKLYNIHKLLDNFFENKIGLEKVIRYKIDHNIKLSQSEDFRILQDVDKTIHGEMNLSECIRRWGTLYVDEKFMPLLRRERQPLQVNTFKHG